MSSIDNISLISRSNNVGDSIEPCETPSFKTVGAIQLPLTTRLTLGASSQKSKISFVSSIGRLHGGNCDRRLRCQTRWKALAVCKLIDSSSPELSMAKVQRCAKYIRGLSFQRSTRKSILSQFIRVHFHWRGARRKVVEEISENCLWKKCYH